MRQAAAKWPLVMFIYFIFPDTHDACVCCPNSLEGNTIPQGKTRACDGYISFVDYSMSVFTPAHFSLLLLNSSLSA